MTDEQLLRLEPMDRFLYWIKERDAIRDKKEAGEPKPWTDNRIFQQYRFTNVRRMDDKVSEWLWSNWYDPYKDHPQILSAVALARFINLPESLGPITRTVFNDKGSWKSRLLVAQLRQRRAKGHNTFNGAYMVRGNDGMDKIDCVVNYYVAPLVKLRGEVDPSSMENTWKALLPSFGMGSFMAGQIVADLRWAMEGQWRDRLTWAPMGPGSLRGMNRLKQRPVKKTLNQDQFLGELADLREKVCGVLPRYLTERLELMDYQNCCCEFDKFERTLHQEGKPKSKYPGV